MGGRPTLNSCTVCRCHLTSDNRVKRTNKCRDCYRAYCREQRKNFTKEQREGRNASARKWANSKKGGKREAYKRYIFSVKYNGCCVDCGNDDWRVLDFDHKDPSEKSCSVSSMIWNGSGMDALKAEIAKCELRCANCHRIKTSNQLGHYKFILQEIEDGTFDPSMLE